MLQSFPILSHSQWSSRSSLSLSLFFVLWGCLSSGLIGCADPPAKRINESRSTPLMDDLGGVPHTVNGENQGGMDGEVESTGGHLGLNGGELSYNEELLRLQMEPSQCELGLQSRPLTSSLLLSTQETRSSNVEMSQSNLEVHPLWGHHRLFTSSLLKTQTPHFSVLKQIFQSQKNVLVVEPCRQRDHQSLQIEILGGGWCVNALNPSSKQRDDWLLFLNTDKWAFHSSLKDLKETQPYSRKKARLLVWTKNKSEFDVWSKSVRSRFSELFEFSDFTPFTPLSSNLTSNTSVYKWLSQPLELSIEQWWMLSQDPHILWIGPALIPPQTTLATGRALVGGDQVQRFQETPETPFHPLYSGWSGQGVKVGLMDSGVSNHPDFMIYNSQGLEVGYRIQGDLPTEGSMHGTIVAGIMAGSGHDSLNVNEPYWGVPTPFKWRGVAPQTDSIWSYLMQGSAGSSSVPPWEQAFKEDGVHLMNHSHTYGNGNYTPENQGYDTFIANRMMIESERNTGREGVNPQSNTLLGRPVIFAAGNSGTRESTELSPFRGYYGLMVNFKNVLTVGAVKSNDGDLANFSSIGPTFDGRIKPDVVAPGSTQWVPPNGIQVEIGEIRLHAHPHLNQPDRVWLWSRPDFWQGDGNFESPISEHQNQSPLLSTLSARSWGGWRDRIYWDGIEERNSSEEVSDSSPEESSDGSQEEAIEQVERSFLNRPIQAEFYYALSIQLKFTLSDPTPPLEHPYHQERDRSYHLPHYGTLRWGDNQGRGRYDEVRYHNYENIRSNEWFELKWTLDEEWEGEIHHLRFNPVYYDDGILSPTGEGGYAATGGTSMAAPMVSGGVALLLEQFQTLFDLNLDENPPSPALIRGILAHTARDLSRPLNAFLEDPRLAANPDTPNFPTIYGQGPDFATGFGLIDLEKATTLVELHSQNPMWMEGELKEGEILEIPILSSSSHPLKVTLIWDDVEGSILTPSWEKKLIHDLDLKVKDSQGNEYGPWVLKPPPLKIGYEDGIDDLALASIEPALRCWYDVDSQKWFNLATQMEMSTESTGSSSSSTQSNQDLPLNEYPRGNQGCLDTLNPIEQVVLDEPRVNEVYWIQIKARWSDSARQPFSLIWSQNCVE